MTETPPLPNTDVKPVISHDLLDQLDIGYADGITPVLAVPETPVPNGARAG